MFIFKDNLVKIEKLTNNELVKIITNTKYKNNQFRLECFIYLMLEKEEIIDYTKDDIKIFQKFGGIDHIFWNSYFKLKLNWKDSGYELLKNLDQKHINNIIKNFSILIINPKYIINSIDKINIAIKNSKQKLTDDEENYLYIATHINDTGIPYFTKEKTMGDSPENDCYPILIKTFKENNFITV